MRNRRSVGRIGAIVLAGGLSAAPAGSGHAGDEMQFYKCRRLDFRSDECPERGEGEKGAEESKRADPSPKATAPAVVSEQPAAATEAPKPDSGPGVPSVTIPPGTPPEMVEAIKAAAAGDIQGARRWSTYPIIVQPGTPPAMVGLSVAVAKGDIAMARRWADEMIRWQQEAMLKVGVVTRLLQDAAIETGYGFPSTNQSQVQLAGTGGGMEKLTLPAFVGRPTLFYFYSPTCPYCRKTTPELVKLVQTRPRLVDGVAIVAVVASADAANQARGIPFRIEVSPEMFASAGVTQTPTFVFADPVTGMASRWEGQTRAEEFEYWFNRVLDERRKPRLSEPWMKREMREVMLPIGGRTEPDRRRETDGDAPVSVTPVAATPAGGR